MTSCPRVLLTRPASEQQQTAYPLEAVGYAVVRAPLIRRTWDVDGVTAFAKEHPDADVVIVSSPLVADILAACAPGAWRTARYVAVGPATATRLKGHGYTVAHQPKHATMHHLIESLGSMSGQTIIYPHSSLTPPQRRSHLKDTGATLWPLVAYHNELPPGARDVLLGALPVDATLLFSSSAAQRLAKILEGRPSAHLGHIVAIGPTTSHAAREAGLPVHIVAREHHLSGMIQELQALLPP